MLADASDKNLASMASTLTQGGKRRILAQRYLSGKKSGDRRILLLDGNPIGIFERVPAATDFRANLGLGAAMRRAVMTSDEKKLLGVVAPALVELGLHFTGLDVLDGKLIEINVTSPSGIPEVNELYGRRIEREIADFIERRLKR